MTPQLILTLSPTGDIRVELPTANGTRTLVDFTISDHLSKEGHFLSYLRDILLHQKKSPQSKIGSAAFPTQHQTTHHPQLSKLVRQPPPRPPPSPRRNPHARRFPPCPLRHARHSPRKHLPCRLLHLLRQQLNPLAAWRKKK